jgi:hypothetical protein
MKTVMHHWSGWALIVVLACGCGTYEPVAPMGPTPAPTSVGPPPSRDAGNWTPFSFYPWHPELGVPLTLNATINTSVEADDLCVSDIYWQWGARSCDRFVVSVPSEGWLHAFLRWDVSAPGFDPGLAGEVVIVASTGRFATSGRRQTEPQVFAKVAPGAYDVLVMSYVQASLPYQLRAEVRPD